MKFADNSNQAADILRQAVPLMVKYNIPPNPLNYALWYTYVSQSLPELNAKLDKAIETYGTCPTMVGEQMFQEHITQSSQDANGDFESNVLKLVADLNSHASQTARSTENYSSVLESSLEAMNEATKTALPLESIIQNLAVNTKEISATTREFQRKIDAAQAEIEALRAELSRTKQDAHADPLTGLFNRRIFDSELEQLVQSSQETRALSLIMLDIDHFKHFNDTYGHLMGDKVLQYVGRLLRDTCEEPVMPVRFGGEEFAILLPGSSLEEGQQLAERLRSKIQAIRIKQKKSGEVISSITASFGISQLQSGENTTSLLDRADKALYKAKENGRNRVETAR